MLWTTKHDIKKLIIGAETTENKGLIKAMIIKISISYTISRQKKMTAVQIRHEILTF